MNSLNNDKYVLSHSGDNHVAKLKYDPKTGNLSVGSVINYSKNSSILIESVEGKAHGALIHSGDTHDIKIDVNDDGTFSGSFEDKNSHIKIELQGGNARIVSGQIPIDGLMIEADHHIISLKLDNKNQLSGSIESKDTENGTFKLKIEQGKVSGSITHSGNGHETNVEILPNGQWKASISTGEPNSKWSLGIENGNAGMRAVAGMNISF
jgi:hypothetical protein